MRKIGWRSPVSVTCNAKSLLQFRAHKKMRGPTLGSGALSRDFTLPTTLRAGARARVGAGAYVRAGMGACVCARVGRRARLRVGIRAFGRGFGRDRVGARVSSWYPRSRLRSQRLAASLKSFLCVFTCCFVGFGKVFPKKLLTCHRKLWQTVATQRATANGGTPTTTKGRIP